MRKKKIVTKPKFTVTTVVDGHPFSSMVWLSSTNYDTPHAHTHTVRNTLPTIAEKRVKKKMCLISIVQLLSTLNTVQYWAASSFVHRRCHTFLEEGQLTVVQCANAAASNCSIIIVHFVIDDSFHHITFLHCPRELCSLSAYVFAHLHLLFLLTGTLISILCDQALATK